MAVASMEESSRRFSLYVFMCMMLVAGAVNIVLVKYQHMQSAPMVPNGLNHHFNHPWLQAALMMAGESLCFPAYLFARLPQSPRSAPKWIFFVPCCCDLFATALLCTGMAFVNVSVAQMCRGTIVVFVCAMSVMFLGRRQKRFQVAGVGTVTFGIFLVSLSAIISVPRGRSDQLLAGILLCIGAQVFQGSMFVYEEKIMSQYVAHPLEVVGTEGVLGVVISIILLATLDHFGYANTAGAFHQIRSEPKLLYSLIASMILIAIFNFCGATVTKRSSSVARTTIKISSTILVWLIELTMGWNKFSQLQLAGFVFVALGTLIYNRLVVVSALEDLPSDNLKKDEEAKV